MKSCLLRSVLPLILAAAPLSAAVSIVLHGPAGSSQPVGTPITWSAAKVAGDSTTLQYRWIIVQNGSNVVFRDFNTTATIRYAPTQEGPYTVIVTARNAANVTETATVSAQYAASSLLKSPGVPTVIATSHPLAAIYSATCTAGYMRVFFAPAGTAPTSGMETPLQPCVSGRSLNFVVAGMRANTTYSLAHQIYLGWSVFNGPTIQFRTGSIPASVHLPVLTVQGTVTANPVVLNAFIGGPAQIQPVAYDTGGQPIWYNNPPAPGGINELMRPLTGGTMVMAQQAGLLQEIDLLSNIVRETNITRMSEQLEAAPFRIINPSIPNRIADFNHEAIRLPNGYTATLSIVERIADQGQGNVDVMGDLILVLNQNYQLVWAWDSFAHLDVKRKATLNDVCGSGEAGCPVLKYVAPGQRANDWIHANSLNYTGDGNLLLSMRDQDWVIKIDYANGAGTGRVLWRLGNQGDFRLASGRWFSHQHDASLTGTRMLLFDNANGDFRAFNGSRGLVMNIDERAKTAEIVTDARMNIFSFVVGSAQTLLNGNLWFLAGFPNPSNSYGIVFSPEPGLATPRVEYHFTNAAYRSFRMKDLYTP